MRELDIDIKEEEAGYIGGYLHSTMIVASAIGSMTKNTEVVKKYVSKMMGRDEVIVKIFQEAIQRKGVEWVKKREEVLEQFLSIQESGKTWKIGQAIFKMLEKNEILRYLPDKITSGKDIIRAAEVAAYRMDWRLNKIDSRIIYVKGDYYNGALEIIDRLERNGWKYVYNSDNEVMTYISPDGKWKINLRQKSSSWVKIENSGYISSATIDVMENKGVPGLKDKFKKINEIKFIYLR